MYNQRFEILEKPYWHCDSRTVCEILESVDGLHQKICDCIKSLNKDFWDGFVTINRIRFLQTTITRETNDYSLRFDDVEQAILCKDSSKLDRKLKKVYNLDRAMQLISCDVIIDKDFIQRLHVCVGEDIIDNNGQFRAREAKPSQECYYYTSPQLIGESLESLLAEYREHYAVKTLSDRVRFSAYFLERFLAIHPFSNGCGRTASCLLACMLLEYTRVPLSLNINRDLYLLALNDSRRKQNSPEILARLILECVEKLFLDICYMLDLDN